MTGNVLEISIYCIYSPWNVQFFCFLSFFTPIFPFRVMKRVLGPIPAAYGRRQATLLHGCIYLKKRNFIYLYFKSCRSYFLGHLARPNLNVQILFPFKPNRAHAATVLRKKIKTTTQQRCRGRGCYIGEPGWKHGDHQAPSCRVDSKRNEMEGRWHEKVRTSLTGLLLLARGWRRPSEPPGWHADSSVKTRLPGNGLRCRHPNIGAEARHGEIRLI